MRSTKLLALLAGGSLLALLAVGPPATAATQPPGPAPGTTMSASAESAGLVYLAYTGTDQQVYVLNAARPAAAATALGGRLIGGPALTVAPQFVLGGDPVLAVFGRGTDNALWWRHQTFFQGGWTRWQSLGGKLTSKPGVAIGLTNQFGKLSVFARGTTGGIFYRVWAQGSWQRWTALGGTRVLPGTGPAGTGPSLLTGLLTFTGADQHVWVVGREGTENGILNVGGRTTADPGVTDTARNGVVFARGTDNALWYKELPYPIAPGSSWHWLGGRLTSGVAATTDIGGKTYVFVLGTDNHIWMRAGAWPSLSGWKRL